MARKKKSKQQRQTATTTTTATGTHSIAAGEFENDAQSAGSTGNSRSLGWGTFGVSQAGVHALRSAQDHDNHNNGHDDGGGDVQSVSTGADGSSSRGTGTGTGGGGSKASEYFDAVQPDDHAFLGLDDNDNDNDEPKEGQALVAPLPGGAETDDDNDDKTKDDTRNDDNKDADNAAVGAAAMVAGTAAIQSQEDNDDNDDKDALESQASVSAASSSLVAAIPFLGNVLSPSKKDVTTDNGKAEDEQSKSSNIDTPNKETKEESSETESHSIDAAAPLAAAAGVAVDAAKTSPDSPPSSPPNDDEQQAARNAVVAAGGAGAAAIVMSRGGLAANHAATAGDATAAAAAEGDVSDTSSQHHNYLPSDLGGAKGLAGDGGSPRELEGPLPTDEGAFDSATRDLKIVAMDKNGVVGGAAAGVDDDSDDLTDEEEQRRRRNRIFALLAICWCCLILLGVLATLLAVYLRDDDDDDLNRGGGIDPPPDVPVFVITESPTVAPTMAPTMAPNPPLEERPVLTGGVTDQLFGSSLAFSDDGNVLAVGGLDGWRVYDSDGDDMTRWTNREDADTRFLRKNLRGLQANNGGSLVDLSGNGSVVAVADMGGTRVRMYRWNTNTGRWGRVGNIVTEFTLTRNIESLAVSGSGQTIAVGGEGFLQVFHFIPGADRWFPRGDPLLPPDLTPEQEEASIGSKMALSQDGKRLVTPTSATGGLTAFEWDYDTNEWFPYGQSLPGFGGPIDTLCMSADGLIIAYSSIGVVRVFSFVDGTWVQLGSDLTGSDSSFGTALAMDGAASLLLVGANESDEYLEDAGEVRFYAYDGNEWISRYDTMYGLQAFDRWGTSVAISRDGRVVAISADQRDGPGNGYVGLYERNV